MLKNRKDVCIHIRHDHEHLNELLHDLIAEKKLEQKNKIFHDFRLHLMAHSKAEEEVFYKALKKMKFNKRQILENIEEHHILEVLITELSKLSVDHERWHAKLELMKNILEKHFKEEEHDIFPLAHFKFSTAELKKLGEQFEKSKTKWFDLYTDVIESHLNFPHAAREVIFEFHKGLV
jgi:hemerythrin superfamily protein